MSALATHRDAASTGVAPVPAPARPWARVAVTDDIAAVAPAWDRLERGGLLTPYQSRGWVEAFVGTVGAAQGMSFRFALASAPDGTPLALFPLVIARRSFCRFAQFIGGKHANYHMGIYEPGFAAALTPQSVQALLGEIAAAIGGLDALAFVNQPVEWNGAANPLALLPHSPSPSPAFKLTLIPGDRNGALQRSLSTHAHKKLRNKRNRFATMGPAALVRARSGAEIARVAADFLNQKAERFAQMGIANPFAEPAVGDFIRRAAAASGAPVELYSLDLDGRSVATYVGAVQGGRFSGMATAFAPDSEAAKTSPGELLLVELIRLKSDEGFSVFDLGVGEARYKTTICDGRDELVDSFLPLTPKGRGFALLARAKRQTKRRIKASPTALRLALRLSGLLARRRPDAEE